MICTAGCDQFVDRQRQSAALQQFLQPGLGILAGIRAGASHALGKQAAHDLAACVPSAIEIDCGNQRLECVGEYRIAPETAALEFTRTQVQLIANFKFARQCSEGRFTDEMRAQSG